MIHIYGIPNCNTVKKSLDWLKLHKVEYTFHDFKKEGISEAKLKSWMKALGFETLVNKKGTTWRGLTPEEQAAASATKGALAIMQEKTSVIKRPIIEWKDGTVTAGLDEETFSALT